MGKLITFFTKMGKLWLKYNNVFIDGLIGTLWISVVTVVLGTILGTILALMRMGKFRPTRWLATAYIEVFRGTPALLQLFFFWIGMPKLFSGVTDTQSIVAGLVVSTAAYIAEIIRAGIGAVDKGQWEAAMSIGLSKKNMMIRVILPQAVKNILPALGNEFISTVKGTSLASTFFVGELMTSQRVVQSATYLALHSLTIVGIIYFALNFVLSKGLLILERRLTVSD